MTSASIQWAVREAGLEELSPEQLQQFDCYLGLLLKWNSKLNLTAVREPEAIIRRHFVECIQCAQILPLLPAGSTLLDFGSGAGLPGIPIAICRPDLRVTLAESQRKKTSFLRETVRYVGLKAEVYDGRVEQMTAGMQFEVVTLRAVDRMIEACQYASRRVASGGFMALFTTERMESDLKLAVLEIAWRESFPTLGLDRGRILIGQRTSR